MLKEMAVQTGISGDGAHEGKGDWEYNKKYNFIKLVNDKLGSKSYQVYKTITPGIFTYFLTKDDNYRGKIQVQEVKNGIQIIASHKESIKGFYQIMFTIMLKEYKEIYSDVMLSTQAIKSYEKLSKKHTLFNIYVKENQEYIPFSKEALLRDKNNTVVIKVQTKNENFIKEHLDEYYKRIQQTENNKPSSFMKMFITKDQELDQYLFGNLTQKGK